MGSANGLNATGLYWWQVNIVSGNGLVPTGNKPLHEPMLTQIYVKGNHNQYRDRANLTNSAIMEQSCISDPGTGG